MLNVACWAGSVEMAEAAPAWPAGSATAHATPASCRNGTGIDCTRAPIAVSDCKSAIERRYALPEIKARLHQASFRDAVLSAYGGRCAISHLPEPRLLDAAHIVMDADEQLGQPVVSNGLPLTKIHHAAFDAH